MSRIIKNKCPLLRCIKCGFEDVLIQGVFARCPKCNGKLEFVKMVDGENLTFS